MQPANPYISVQQNQRRTFWHNTIGSTGQNQGRKKNELTLLYSALIEKSLYAKLIVLRLMVTCYIGNMIAFLHCHYAYL